MGKKSNIFRQKSRDREAENWYDSTDESRPFDPFESQEARKRIGKEMLQQMLDRRTKQKTARRQSLYYFKAAALFLLITSAALFFWKPEITGLGNSQEWQLVKTGKEVKKFVLADGSTVHLNAYSKLRFPQTFTGKLRDVELLEGEAHFEVTHNPQKPFIVRSGKLSTKVLGTSFNIEIYPNESALKVSLIRGKIAVHHDELPARLDEILSPGQTLSYDRLSKKTSVGATSVSNVAAWKENSLVFNDLRLSDALDKASRYYGTDIEVAKDVDLTEKHITGEYRQQTIDEVLSAILMVHHLNYIKKGRTIYVNEK